MKRSRILPVVVGLLLAALAIFNYILNNKSKEYAIDLNGVWYSNSILENGDSVYTEFIFSDSLLLYNSVYGQDWYYYKIYRDSLYVKDPAAAFYRRVAFINRYDEDEKTLFLTNSYSGHQQLSYLEAFEYELNDFYFSNLDGADTVLSSIWGKALIRQEKSK